MMHSHVGAPFTPLIRMPAQHASPWQDAARQAGCLSADVLLPFSAGRDKLVLHAPQLHWWSPGQHRQQLLCPLVAAL